MRYLVIFGFCHAGIVTPDTILRWYRQLVVRMAQENTGWVYTRLRDALWHLGHELGRNTVKHQGLGGRLIAANEWFDVEFHSVVVDLGDGDIVKEEEC